MYFGSLPSSLPHVKSGKVRAIAVTGAQRSAVTPSLPTIAESGVAGFESIQWYGLLAPGRTPTWIVDKLNRDFVAALRAPEVKERLFAQGFEVVGNTRSQFAAFIKSEIAKWAKVVKEAQIRVD
jgi:tripartite-type tricarboxylate transporter receptor subunit TctC